MEVHWNVYNSLTLIATGPKYLPLIIYALYAIHLHCDVHPHFPPMIKLNNVSMYLRSDVLSKLITPNFICLVFTILKSSKYSKLKICKK